MVKYSALLEKDPVLAARTAVRAANEEVQQERPLSEKDVLRGFSFEVGGRVVHYVTDYSDIWDGGGGRDYTSLSLLATCLNSLPNEPSGIRTEMVDTIIRSAVVGVVWKRLVETAANHAKDMFDDVEALFHSSQFLAAPEITVSVGKLLVAVNDQGNLTKERFKPIENAILAISDETPVLRYESAESIRKRLLASVDRALLSSKAVKILSTGEPARENRPLFEVTGGAVSQLEALRIRGINPDDKDNAEILSALDPVEQFNHRFINGEVDLSDANSVLEPIKKLQGVAAEAGAKGVSNELVVRGRGALIAASAVVLRAIGLDTNSEMFQLAKDIAFAGAVDLDPVFDPRYHLPFDHPGWGGPSPRIEAAQAVVSLVWNYDRSAVALETLEALSKDKVPAVRFQIARGLLGLFVYEPGRETFWRILQQMLHEETTEGVLIGLLSTLRSVARITPERTVSFLHKLLERGLPQAKRSDSSRLALDILVGLYVWQGFAPALHELARFEANVEISQADLSQIALTAFQYISPADIEIAAVRERARELLTRVFDVAQRFSIEEGRKTTPRNLAPPAIILETIASRLFFAFDLIGTRAPNQKPMTDEQRKQLYSELGPFIDRVCQVEDEEATVPLIAQGAHYLLQLMNGILFIDPSRVLLCASAVCRHGSKTGYLMDSLAHSEAVKLVEQTVADHREILRDDKIAGAMGSMLDQFIRAGWPEAITLSFKLEDAFR
jgi:hypothetical protein